MRRPVEARVVAEADRGISLGDGFDLLHLLWAVVHDLQKASHRMERVVGMTGPQRLVVRIVGRFPGIAAGRVARILGVHPSTVTGLARRLETRGLLRRRVDPKDRRRLELHLTAAGRAAERNPASTIEAALEKLLATAPPATVAGGRDLLESLRQILLREREAEARGKTRSPPRRA